ncbi:chorismate-binding protein, partial [uncultured Duncaniella sp.]|uniref:chorismate-binding protein n=1 Tax=uncultured Duncaniella sp. TaxID=2768039 RepID=UPI0026E35611
EGKSGKVKSPFDVISAFLPAGTLSGAPKIRAMEIIDELESVRPKTRTRSSTDSSRLTVTRRVQVSDSPSPG